MKARKLTSNPEEVLRKDLKGLKLDELDRKNIQYTIDFFEKAFPGVIAQHAKDGRAETLAAIKKNDGLNFTRRMAIPEGLWVDLKRQYPSIMVDTKQFEQFLAWFPIFDMAVR